MATFPEGWPNWGAVRDLLYPALHAFVGVAKETKSRCTEASFETDFASDRLMVNAKFVLFDRHEILDGSFKRKCYGRLRDILGVHIPPALTAHDHRVQRRQLHHRGHLARQAKAKRK